MDLGIKGRRALVMAASKGLGKACALALAREGVAVTITARGAAELEATAEAIRRETGAAVTPVAADMFAEAGRAAVLKACPDPDILVTNVGGAPPADYTDWTEKAWAEALNMNLIAPAMMIRACLPAMIARKFGRIVNVTSYGVKMPLPRLSLSAGAKTGLTAAVAGLAREVVRHNVTINNLQPGPFATDRLRANTRNLADKAGKAFDEVWAARQKANPAQRFGDPAEFGAFCAFLCGAQAGFMTGQNVTVDGGEFPGML